MLSFTSRTNKVDREMIQNFLDTRPEVLNWFGAMPYTIILISNSDVRYLTKLLMEKYDNDISFLITPIVSENMDGFIGRPVWDFINNPKPSGRWS